MYFSLGFSLFLPVDDLVLVEVLQAEDDTGRVEDGPGLREDVGVDVHHEVAAGGVLHNEADVGVRLEAGEHVDEEGVPHRVGHFEDPLFGQQRLHLVPRDDVALLQRFDGEVLASVLVTRQNNLGRGWNS